MVTDWYKKIKELYERYDRPIGIASMLFGFILDSLTLKRIDLFASHLVLFTYLAIALTCIILIHAYTGGKIHNTRMGRLQPFLPIPMQVAFGGLFSGFVVFYSKSATLIANWPFITILVLLMLGNELAKSRYARFTYRIAVFYTALLSFSIFYLPVITRRMGAAIFIFSGIISLIIIAGVLFLLFRVAREPFMRSQKWLIISILVIFSSFQILYFTNIIPPVPLALKGIGAYHDLARVNNLYRALAEPSPWYRWYEATSQTFHRELGERVYVFSSIFAPTRLTQPVYHQWFWYDAPARAWQARDRLSFSITGGRDGGYRGYSYKQDPLDGDWRVDVVTSRNQLIGRIRFTVITVTSTPPLVPVSL